jgi:HK97 family phage major capsid protein
MNPIRRQIHPETRIVDARKGIVDYVASDETLDSYKEIIRASGWRFTNFAKNAPFVDSHDYSTISKCLGRVIDFRVANGQLIERVQWAIDVPENELAQIGWKMTAANYIKAVSVGFFPTKFLTPNSGQAWTDALAELELTGDTEVRTIYTEQEQVELSACIIGANPNALAKARSDGIIGDGHLDRFPAIREAIRQRTGRTFSFPPATQTPTTDPMTNLHDIFARRSGVPPTSKAAFEKVENLRRDGTRDEIGRAVTQARIATALERRNAGLDPVEQYLEQPGMREFWNALARCLLKQPYPEEFAPVFKDLDLQATGPGAAWFLPQAMSDQIFDLLPIYGAFNFLGLRKLPKLFTKFPAVTGLPSAVFINSTAAPQAIPADTAFLGTSLLPQANQVASMLPISLQLFEDAAVDLGSVLARYFVQGLSSRVDYAAFQGNGVADASNGGMTGIMAAATVKTFNAAKSTVESLDRMDFLGVLSTIAPSALQRECRWFINPGFIPLLLRIAEGNGAYWTLKTPAETSDGTWSLVGFPVTWAAQMPAVDAPGQKFAAFLQPDSYLVGLSDEFAIGASDFYGWSTLQKVFRAYARVWCQLRDATGVATLTTAAH